MHFLVCCIYIDLLLPSCALKRVKIEVLLGLLSVKFLLLFVYNFSLWMFFGHLKVFSAAIAVGLCLQNIT